MTAWRCKSSSHPDGGEVDLDLEKLFDRVNHDRLMKWLALRIADKRMLRLIFGLHGGGRDCEL
jgi:retron-type reverse transcriptase